MAGPWVARHDMPALADRLEQAGHSITERWWEHEDDHAGPMSNESNMTYEERAVSDFIGVVKADVLVVVNSSKSEGKAVEQGVAHAGNKPVSLIGTRSNVFHYLPNVYPVKDVDEAIERLAA